MARAKRRIITCKGKTWTLNGANLFFPAAGYRNGGSGALDDVGTRGRCWSATPGSACYGRSLGFNSGSWIWNNDCRAYGFSVRPVAEE